MRRYQDDPDVRAAQARVEEEQHAIRQAERELDALQKQYEAAQEACKGLKAKAHIGDASEADVEAAHERLKDAAQEVAEKEQEVETRREAIRLLEGKVGSARSKAFVALRSELEAEYPGTIQRLVDVMAEAADAAEVVVQLEAEFEANGFHLPPYALRVLSREYRDKTRAGIFRKEAWDFLDRVTINGFRPSNTAVSRDH